MEIPKIFIPEIKTFQHKPYQVLSVPPPSLKIPGCVRYHRDASPKNTALYNDDPTGTMLNCAYGSMPTFEPMLYDRRRIQIVETKQEQKKEAKQEQPKVTSQEPKLPKKKEKEFFIKCPGDKDQRVGDFRNEKRLERVIGHKRGDDEIECITLYEDVPFVDQYIPEPSTIVSTAVIGLVAASSPLILNIIKPAIKNIVKKLTKKKDSVE